MSEARDTRVIEENQRQVERLTRLGWYHSIELPGGGVIEGHQSIGQLRRRIEQFPVPGNLTGKRVLDIGAWDGWFSFEMERRGADVLAVDSTRNTRLLEAKKLLNSKIEYRIADICRLTAKDVGTFDIVLFLGVLYHLKHPLLALENVCGMCRDMACIESFVTDADPRTLPSMEFYETAELRGQLDNWIGPNAACLLAFCRTAGFARVRLESVLGERAHVTGYRRWDGSAGSDPAPHVLCIENSATHDHEFSSAADDYITFYFTTEQENLTCDNVYPQIGPFGSRPIHVAPSGNGWQATCKLPPNPGKGWHNATLRIRNSRCSAPLRIGVDLSDDLRHMTAAPADGSLRIRRVADGRTFESNRVRTGAGSAISIWVEGLPLDAAASEIRVRMNGTDLSALWLAPASGKDPRQINALLPSGLAPGSSRIAVVLGDRQSESATIELERS